MKIWGGNGRRTAKRNAAGSDFERETAYDEYVRAVARQEAPPAAKQERIIDFETLLKWYNEQNAAAAAGNESSVTHKYETKQRSLKFL